MEWHLRTVCFAATSSFVVLSDLAVGHPHQVMISGSPLLGLRQEPPPSHKALRCRLPKQSPGIQILGNVRAPHVMTHPHGNPHYGLAPEYSKYLKVWRRASESRVTKRRTKDNGCQIGFRLHLFQSLWLTSSQALGIVLLLSLSEFNSFFWGGGVWGAACRSHIHAA